MDCFKIKAGGIHGNLGFVPARIFFYSGNE